ncbi:MAG: N-6 DNA methylase [Candidatus Sericytochromatia bacterium]|nr:N-6 DNA methylase [Candidatus Sericytochromatia bacterium]
MLIKHLSKENIYFSKSYKDTFGNIILNAWDDLTKSDETIPVNFYKQIDKKYIPIIVKNNKIEETFSIDDIKLTENVQIKKSYTINGIQFDPFLDIEKVYFYIDGKQNLNFLYSQENEFFKIGKTLKVAKDTKSVIEKESSLSIQDKKNSYNVIKVITDSTIFSDNGEKYFLNGIDIDTLDFEEDDTIGIDSFKNAYLISGEKFKIFNDKKTKAIKEKDIVSAIFYEENNQIVGLKEFEFEGVQIVKKLTLKDLEDLLWDVADLIRDKSSLDDVMDYMRVSIPLLTIKRLLDIREEYLNEHILISNNITYESNKADYPQDYLQRTFNDVQQSKAIFAVMEDKIEWYGVTWDDITSFIEQDKEIEREITLKKFPITIKTKATTRQMFLKEIIDNFYQEDEKISKLKRIFKVTEFINKIKDEKKISKEVFEKLLSLLSEYSFNYKNANEDIFSNAYMYLISEFAAGAGKKGGEFFTPTELIRKLLPFLEIELPEVGNIIIGDPTAGSCSFVLEAGEIIKQQLIKQYPELTNSEIEDMLNERVQFVTQEKGETSEVMGELNLMFKGFTNHISFNANSITEYMKNLGQYRKKFRYAVGNPPYGLKSYGVDFAASSGEERWSFGIPADKEGEYAFIETFIDMLDDNGKAGIVLPLGALFKDSTRAIRKKLIEEDLIEGLIMLPGAMFQTTQIPVVFWIINKNKKDADKNKIFMVNASEEFIKESKFNIWQHQKTFTNYIDRIEEKGISGYIDNTEIEKKGWNLYVSRYVFKEYEEENINLEEILKEISLLNDSISNNLNFINPIKENIIKINKG